MAGIRKVYSPELKKKVVIEAIKEIKTFSEITSEYKVKASQISKWKKHVLEHIPELFKSSQDSRLKEKDELIERLYGQIGKLNVEVEWLKKKLEIA